MNRWNKSEFILQRKAGINFNKFFFHFSLRQFSTDLGLISRGSDQFFFSTPNDRWSVKDEIVTESLVREVTTNSNLSAKER